MEAFSFPFFVISKSGSLYPFNLLHIDNFTRTSRSLSKRLLSGNCFDLTLFSLQNFIEGALGLEGKPNFTVFPPTIARLRLFAN